MVPARTETSRHVRVLAIDDDPDALALIKVRLENTGRFSVTTAGSGADGLAQVYARRPMLIICDIYMPGMSGADVAAALAADPWPRDVPLLFLSALVRPSEVSAHHGKIGGWPMASKNESLDTILARIDALLERQLHG